LLSVNVVALYGSDIRDRHTVAASSISSLAAPPSLQDVRRSSPSMRAKFSQQQLISSGSEDSLSSVDKNSLFDLGIEPRLVSLLCYRFASRCGSEIFAVSLSLVER